MERLVRVQNQLRPQEQVFGMEELLTPILEFATPNRAKEDLLRYRAVGRIWAKCASRMFEEPPFKICLNLEGLLSWQQIYQFETHIHMEVTVTGMLTSRKLDFLNEMSENIQILHLVGLEGIDAPASARYYPLLPNLQRLVVNNQFEVYYNYGPIFNFITYLAKLAPKLEVFQIVYDEKVTRLFEKTPGVYILPKLMTALKAVNVDAFSLHKVLQQNPLRNLSAADFKFNHSPSRYRSVSENINYQFGNSPLRKLKLQFEATQDDYIRIYPLRTLEEFETNVSIHPFDGITPLSLCLPNLKSLTCTGGLLITLSSFVMEGSTYERLQNLTLNGPNLHSGDDPLIEHRWNRIERLLLEKIDRIGFPQLPNLVSLTWNGFTVNATDALIPKFFENAKKLSELNVCLRFIIWLCLHYARDQPNFLCGTNFSRLKTLTLHGEWVCVQEMGRLLHSPISMTFPELKTIHLGENLSIDKYTKKLWEMSGRKMIIDPAQIREFCENGKLVTDPFKLNFGLGEVEVRNLEILSRPPPTPPLPPRTTRLSPPPPRAIRTSPPPSPLYENSFMKAFYDNFMI